MKKFLSLILSLSIAFGTFSLCAFSVNAAEKGTTPTNAINLSAGKWHTRYWTNSNYDAKCYNKIKVPQRGYIKFTIEKPTDDEGEVCTYELNLYNTSGKIIWTGNKDADTDIFNNYYEYKIGLDEGTYYMDINPSFYVYSDSSPIKTSYQFTFKKTSSFEIEGNDNYQTATTIYDDKETSAVFDENDDSDFYKAKLTKGRKYTVRITNYNSNMYYSFFDPNQDEKYFTTDDYDWYYGKETVSANTLIWTFTAEKSGYHYIQIEGYPDNDLSYKVTISAAKTPASKVKAKLSTDSYTYNGNKKTPSVKVVYGSKTLKKGTDYTVSYANGRKNVGKYKVKIKFKGAYSGSKSLYFNIVPPATKISKVKAGKTSLKVTVSKKKNQISGYQVQGSSSKKFNNARTITLKGYKSTSYTFKGLKSKKAYYFRVRTFKSVNGKRYYSAWSSYKAKKTK